MAMPLHRITELILKYHRGTLSPEEQAELQEWQAGSERHQRLVRELTDEEWLKPRLEHQDLYSEQRVWEKFKQMVPEVLSDGGEAEPLQVLAPHARLIGLRWAAAAAILILLGTGSYFAFFNKNSKSVALTQTQDQRVKNDVLPGDNKAVLTLSGGRQIILDSAANGGVAIQGNAQVQKLANGQLAYQRIDEKPTTVLYNTLTTPRGGQYELTLPDGTKVWLNAASSITYPTAFVNDERKVSITGEVYFEVVKKASKPFKVSINGNTEIEVLGTSFNINAYDDEKSIKTTLLEGSVRLVVGGAKPAVGVNTNSNRNTNGGTPNNNDNKLSFVLKPGQQVQVVGVNTNNGENNKIRLVNDVDVDEVLAWKNGLFAFTDADLPTVMRQLSRWYNIDVTYEGNIPNQQFNGKIGKTLTLSQVLDVLGKSSVRYTIEPGNKLTVRRP